MIDIRINSATTMKVDGARHSFFLDQDNLATVVYRRMLVEETYLAIDQYLSSGGETMMSDSVTDQDNFSAVQGGGWNEGRP